MCKTPGKEHGRYKVECGILMKLITVELAKNTVRPPDWADTGKILHVRNDLKKLLANMRLAPGSIEEEVNAKIEKEISLRKERSEEAEERMSRVKSQTRREKKNERE